jgi:hypothetical protein
MSLYGDTFMKRALLGALLAAGVLGLSGCYYDPGYSYVRSNGYSGPAYYGTATSTVVYGNGYPGYYGSGYGYGCCYSPGVVVGGVWYRDGYRGRNWNRGPYQGWRGGDWHGSPRSGYRGGDWRSGSRPGYNGPRGHAGPRPGYNGPRQGNSGPRQGNSGPRSSSGPRSDAHRQNAPRNTGRGPRIMEQ